MWVLGGEIRFVWEGWDGLAVAVLGKLLWESRGLVELLVRHFLVLMLWGWCRECIGGWLFEHGWC